MIRLTQLSRTVSHALRHEPWLFELELDENGWVRTEDLLTVLRVADPAWASLEEIDLDHMIRHSTKRRHELCDGKIRALYGHSVPQRLLKERATPPSVLYHGTSPTSLVLIQSEGLRPMRRQFVHLSIDTATAIEVGRRKAAKPVVLRVDAIAAHNAGVSFYLGNEHVWLADCINSQFVSPMNQGNG